MHDHGHRHGGGHGHGGGHDRNGNPELHAEYLARLLDPERDAWQKPEEVVATLGLREGGVACDVGAGPGVFTLRMARVVGPRGRVHAIDVDPRMTALLEERLRAEGAGNVTVQLAEDGRGLPPEPVDAVLLVNVLHHFPEPVPYLAALAARLRPGGRLVNVDFHAGESPVGPPPEHRVSREAFLALAAEAGLRVLEERSSLPYQYLVALGR